jgi:hypothetical protein
MVLHDADRPLSAQPAGGAAMGLIVLTIAGSPDEARDERGVNLRHDGRQRRNFTSKSCVADAPHPYTKVGLPVSNAGYAHKEDCEQL